MNTFYNAERGQGKVTLHLSPKYNSHTPVPFELQTFITPGEWETRIREITRIGSQYSKVWLERIWTVTAIIATFLLPMVLYRVAFDALNKDDDDFQTGNSHFFEARMIAFGIFVGAIILFWTPLAVWKYIGRIRMRALVKRWTDADVLARAAGAFVPVWRVQTPGIFDPRIILTVTTPPSVAPTVFHPQAYLPPYVAGGYYPPYPGDSKIREDFSNQSVAANQA